MRRRWRRFARMEDGCLTSAVQALAELSRPFGPQEPRSRANRLSPLDRGGDPNWLNCPDCRYAIKCRNHNHQASGKGKLVISNRHYHNFYVN
jgi:hypothetical protein